MNCLIVVSAPSGAGKTTLCKRLLDEFKSSVQLSISATTRAPRGKEEHGREYFFVSREEFERMIRDGEFAEHARVHDNYYGTPKSMISTAFRNGKSVLLDIDVQGAESLRRTYPEYCLSVFIAPPNLEVLEQRLRSRGTDSEASIERRMQNARGEMEQSSKFDHVIVNDNLDRAYAELRSLVEQRLPSRQRKGVE